MAVEAAVALFLHSDINAESFLRMLFYGSNSSFGSVVVLWH